MSGLEKYKTAGPSQWVEEKSLVKRWGLHPRCHVQSLLFMDPAKTQDDKAGLCLLTH